MSKFTKKKISSSIVGVVDVGSYKVRVGICEFEKENIRLIGFSEKRQSSEDVVNNEIKNLEGLCENIEVALKKAEKEAGVKVEKIIINPVFSENFIYSKKVSYHRKSPLKIIDEKELEKIVGNIEEIALHTANKIIKNKSVFSIENVEIITSNISQITIDKDIVSSPLKQTGENISFHVLNIFIPKLNFEIISYIGNYLNKKVIKILPEDFCLAKIWEKNKDVVIINIGNSSSYITIRDKKGNIVGTEKIGVGIETLINTIKDNSDFSRAEIIKKMDREDFHVKEKKEFLDIYTFLITEGLKEILGNKNCPNNFFIVGGGGNNSFFKNNLKKVNWSEHGIIMNGNLKFILPDIEKLGKIENIENVLNKSNLNIVSMILTYAKILNHKENIVEKYLKNAVNKIIYK